MPASSRKRNKGRDRKAKKEESKRVAMYNIWQKWARGNMGSAGVIQCKHDLVTTVPDLSHPVSSFINEYFLCDDTSNSLQHHEALQNLAEGLDDRNRKLAMDLLTLVGANLLLSNNIYTVDVTGREAAFAILVLEKYWESQTCDFDSVFYSRDVSRKIWGLTMSATYNNRDLLKFFRKRMSCKCLKKMHLEARKTLPKLGVCHNCEVVKERESLMVCSRCKIYQFCSRDCHVAASPEHRPYCDKGVRAEQIVANTTT